MKSVTEYILQHVARTSTARPLFKVCAGCHTFQGVKTYGAPTPGISHGMCEKCFRRYYGDALADKLKAEGVF